MSWIVDQLVIYEYPDGRRQEGRIAFAAPVEIDDKHAGCELSLDGFEHRPKHRIYGDTPLQALLLAVQFAGCRLHDFVTRGGRVLDRTGEEIQLAAYFGPLLRDPP